MAVLRESHRSLGLASPEAVFEFLLKTLRPGIRQWDYFVNWDKVFRNSQELEVTLNIWNALLGKDNFEGEFRLLVARYPEIVMAIPSLIVRDGKASKTFDVLEEAGAVSHFDFSVPAESPEQVEAALKFVQGSGLSRLFERGKVTNLVDYVIGVEAGVDSNGRKNRGGSAMETLVGDYVASVCKSRGFNMLKEASAATIRSEWDSNQLDEFPLRRFDFAINTGTKILVIEVNFYSAGGSKLKSVAGEFIELEQRLHKSEVGFVWITDGQGWGTTAGPLKKAFLAMDNVLNLRLMSSGVLEEVLS